ncbi:4-galactosyl-N-acetylglucosaminide 3-alpha-L-fucosyltransferase 9-like [Clavelina lepadiformis]|uniref:4-galactosyl-N-acetylglucosaminide 3-alpha-L-fucosyltransferase 9-like n=1 Tax=Clavelina lepadiformis TaxID=159417 RepID=UPI00404392DC
MKLFAKWGVFVIFILSAIVTTMYIYSTEVWIKTTALKFRSLLRISSSKMKLTNLIANTSRTYILFWDHPWSVPTEGISEGNLGGCMGTYDRSKFPDAGAVVFHYSNLDRESMPWKHYRDPEQIFVFSSHESPSYVIHGEHRHSMTKFDDHFINWTMTYRTDSDVFAPYEQSKVINKIIDEGGKWIDSKLAKKKKVALWVVSNCALLRGSKMRMKYTDALVEAGLSVDRFGGCFNNKDDFKELSADDMEAYKFYLAFENAQYCKDYMTEKFWRNSIGAGRVPVVWGPSKKDVEKLSPTGSFIHTDDFKTPADLAKYLLYLDSNDKAYREYFKWIEDPDEKTLKLAKTYKLAGPYRLCKMMLSNRVRQSHPSVSDFFYNEKENCISSQENVIK